MARRFTVERFIGRSPFSVRNAGACNDYAHPPRFGAPDDLVNHGLDDPKAAGRDRFEPEEFVREDMRVRYTMRRHLTRDSAGYGYWFMQETGEHGVEHVEETPAVACLLGGEPSQLLETRPC